MDHPSSLEGLLDTLVRFETAIQGSAQTCEWLNGGRRAQWLSDCKDSSRRSAAFFATLALAAERNIRSEGQLASWSSAQPAWVGKCQRLGAQDYQFVV